LTNKHGAKARNPTAVTMAWLLAINTVQSFIEEAVFLFQNRDSKIKEAIYMSRKCPNLQKAAVAILAILIAFGHQYLYSFQSPRIVFVVSALVYFFLGMKLRRKAFVGLSLLVSFLWWLMVGLTTDFHGAWWIWALDIGCMGVPLIIGGSISDKLNEDKLVFVKSFSLLIMILASIYFLLVPHLEFSERLTKDVGKKAPSWVYAAAAQDSEPNKITGRILYLDFWFTNCGYCFKGFKELQQVHDYYKTNPNVSVYAIHNGSGSPQEISRGIAKIRDLGYDFPILVDSSGIFRKSNLATVYPSQLLVDQKGKVNYRIIGYGVDSRAWQVNWIKHKIARMIKKEVSGL
jgi:thiol-disulfide isomerase/thioredoxin